MGDVDRLPVGLPVLPVEPVARAAATPVAVPVPVPFFFVFLAFFFFAFLAGAAPVAGLAAPFAAAAVSNHQLAETRTCWLTYQHRTSGALPCPLAWYSKGVDFGKEKKRRTMTCTAET